MKPNNETQVKRPDNERRSPLKLKGVVEPQRREKKGLPSATGTGNFPNFLYHGGPVINMPQVYALFVGDWSSAANQNRATRLSQFVTDLLNSRYMNIADVQQVARHEHQWRDHLHQRNAEPTAVALAGRSNEPAGRRQMNLELVYRLLNPLGFVAFKMGRRRGARRAHI